MHLAFTDAFVAAHKAYGGPIPGGFDAYVAEWAAAEELMGLQDPPRSDAELRDQLAAFDGDLSDSAQVQETLTYIRRPPLPRLQRPGYQILFAGTAAKNRIRRITGANDPSPA